MSGTETKTSVGLKLGYSCGQFTDSIPFNLFYTYFLYFLTDVVGLPAVCGGIISLVVVLWDAVTDPLIGHLSDQCRSKYGRRRPFMMAGMIPLFFCTILLFTKVDFGNGGTFIYYGIAGILFWTFYTMYVIPYFALGAELTRDFNDRTTLRGFAGIAIYLAVWIVIAGPMFVQDVVEKQGGSEADAWIVSAILFGLAGLTGGFVCWRTTRGKELVQRNMNLHEKKRNLMGNYLELLKLKAFRLYLGMVVFYNIAFAIAQAALVYIMSTNLRMGASEKALYWTVFSVITILFVPISSMIGNRIGKKSVMIVFNLISVAGCIFFYFYGISNFKELIWFTLFYNIGNVCYWSVGYSMMYDCVELDQYTYGMRREGSIVGMSSFVQKMGSAIGMYVTGFLLSTLGYDGSAQEQSARALHGILTVNTLIPGVLLGAGTIFVMFYPITKKYYNELVKRIESKQ